MRPILFTLGGMAVRSYHVFLVLAFLTAFGLFLLEVRRRRLGVGTALDLALCGLVPAIAGGKLGYLLAHMPHLSELVTSPGKLDRLIAEGWSGTGMLLGLLAGAVVCFPRKRLDGWQWADAAAPSLAAAEAISRVGCFLTGCCYGTPTRLPWAVVFTASEVVPLNVPLHPTQLYQALLSAGIFLFLLIRRSGARYDGELILAFTVLYALSRGFVDCFRADAIPIAGIPVTAVHVVSALAIFGAVILYRKRRRVQPRGR